MAKDLILTRRRLLAQGLAMAAVSLVGPWLAHAGDAPIELSWSDLVPQDGGTEVAPSPTLGVVQHGQMSTPFDPEAGALVTDEFDGELVRIRGYLVPLEYDGTQVISGLLVPYIGACIHVPPPPPNQLVFITTEDPYEGAGLFEPVSITGVFGVAPAETKFAKVGYALSADRIEPYG